MDNILIIKTNELVAKDTYKLVLKGDIKEIKNPGQFANLSLNNPEFYLRRPLSISDYNKDELVFYYKTFGEGTKYLSTFKKDDTIDVLYPLGNGFTIKKENEHQLLIGGGVGVPPLYNLAKELIKNHIKPKVILGFNTKDEIFLEKEFRALGLEVVITTMDGSDGFKGNVVDYIKENDLDKLYYYACGPKKMLDALVKTSEFGQLSFESRMGCGFGACMGCTCKTKTSKKRICKEGPVLDGSEVVVDE
ncbi:dihydroorotate dehydrogenase electron transfer subunit [Candidatus Izimaplasma sp. ZiA1]|uniref:dihydroorotate dehydrogenase electron transfer subunit n=1 Tax=Candidatus Izimoplasma sp. ZiA1 TaxID=2024899 RepID=UPI001F0B0025